MLKGIIYAVTAYVSWGLLAIYWKALETVPALQILGHRIAWSFVILWLILMVSGRWQTFWGMVRQPRLVSYHFAGAILIGVNWLTYIWGVNAGYVVETSLGYFINPLVSVVLGMLFLHERLRPWQWLPLGLAVVGVCYLTFIYGSLPWIALILAFSFGCYGLIKKKAPLGAIDGLAMETAILLLPALAYLLLSEDRGQGVFLHGSWIQNTLLIGGGLMTVLPLLCFAVAAQRIPLSLVGILQYIAPTLQFLVGTLIYHEPVPQDRLWGFILVWIALLIFVVEGLWAKGQRGSCVIGDVAQ